ncbi:MAG: hypothetical protein A2Z11_03845 [Candidatus Woykebacteria bacterium RBG_16_43_9]|uniref:Solute-binding protein family 5 domain-containing protein n=1 Tax=Candidatus Woykebacteria bacterium RBG_16_43_9 TaxID=1802596 RepID=A0A1G1WD22_9BACT|nr:MAG: hypothetical protein A2Z11_03845 [Candidatus Woykebacteria bacterium RBG_16_43_9]
MDQLPAQNRPLLSNKTFYAVFLVLVIAILGVLVIWRVISPKTQTRGADYIEGLAKEKVTIAVLDKILGLYPNIPYDVDSFSINSNIFEGLTILRNGRLQPALAESWTNPDKLTWRIRLRNVKFHSGDLLKASDVKYTIEEAKKNKDWMSNTMASRVDSVNVIDERTVELKTKNPDPTLLYWMVYLFILSEDQVKKDSLGKAVGTGPYRLVSINENEAVFEANNNYWAGIPKVKKLVYKAFKDQQAQAQGLADGEADVGLLFKKTLNETLKSKGFRIIESRLGYVGFLGFDINNKKAKYVEADKNPFSDVRVRKAMLLTLDVNEIIKNSGREGEPLTQLATSELIGFNTKLRRPEPNVKEAKKLLTEAGFPNGFTVTLDALETSELASEQIKNQLAEIGIKVKLNIFSDFNGFIDKLYAGDSSFYYFGYVSDTLDSVDLLNTLVHPTDERGNGSANFSSYSNAELDSILDKASTIFDVKERAEITTQAHKKVMDQLPLIPMSTTIGFFAVRNDVAFKPAPFGYIFGFELSGRQKASSTAQ